MGSNLTEGKDDCGVSKDEKGKMRDLEDKETIADEIQNTRE
jgi:hypothetical protein